MEHSQHSRIARQHAQGVHDPLSEEAALKDKEYLAGAQARQQRDHDNIVQLRKDIQRKKEMQAKSEAGPDINDPNDKHEKEADEVAAKVTGESGAAVSSAGSSIQRKEEAGTEKLMAKSEDGKLKGTGELQATLDSSKGSGEAMDDETKSEMEEKMNADLSDVRIHTGAKAHDMSEGINAKAFTHGQDIYFKNGNYDPQSKEGKSLLAHELAHTRQQKGGLARMVQRGADDANDEASEELFTTNVVGTNVKVKIGPGKETASNTKLIPIEDRRSQLLNSFNWNGIAKIMKHVDEQFDTFTYNVTGLKGTAADDKIFVPDAGIEHIIKSQAKYYTDLHKEDIEKKMSVIISGVDGLVGPTFAEKIMGLSANINDIRDESSNKEMTDPNDPAKNITMPNFDASELELYDALRGIVMARNGAWIDEGKMINLVGIRRKLDADKTKYNDTIAVCWKEQKGDKDEKHCKLYTSTTEPGDLSDNRTLYPSTITVIPGYHSGKIPALRTEKIYTRKDNADHFDANDGVGLNIHPGGPSMGWDKQKISAKLPGGKTTDEKQFMAWKIFSEVFSILYKWQYDDSQSAYENLGSWSEGKVEFASNDDSVIKLKKGKKEADRSVAAIKDWLTEYWITGSTKKPALLARILKHVDSSFEEPKDFSKLSAEKVKEYITSARVEGIIKEQIKYFPRLESVDGKAGPSFIEIMDGGRQEVTEDMVTRATTDKTRIDDLLAKSKDYPEITADRKTYLKELKPNKEGEEGVYKGAKDTDDKAKKVDEAVGGWSTACQVILGGGKYYEFLMNTMSFTEETGQRRWYYTLIDQSSLKMDTKEGSIQEK
jgi:hypothetical protein